LVAGGLRPKEFKTRQDKSRRSDKGRGFEELAPFDGRTRGDRVPFCCFLFHMASLLNEPGRLKRKNRRIDAGLTALVRIWQPAANRADEKPILSIEPMRTRAGFVALLATALCLCGPTLQAALTPSPDVPA